MQGAVTKSDQSKAGYVPQAILPRNVAFSKRLESACDGHPHVPPLHSGRLTWIRDELAKRHNVKVTIETVRRWFSGLAAPRADKVALLARLLEVDQGWLQVGIDPALQPRERKVRNAMVDGVVNVVAGFIQMDGGHPAFPEETDKRAQKDNVDLYAIIKGANYALHVSMGTQDGDTLRFPVPVNHENVIVLGVVRNGLAIEIVELPAEVIEAHGTRRGASIDVAFDPKAAGNLRRVGDFSQRL